MAIGTALAVGLGASALGGALGAKSQKKAAKRAAGISQQTADTNNALAQQVYQGSSNALTPYMMQGNPAGTQLNAMLGIGNPVGGTAGFGDGTGGFDTFRNSSGYNFIRDQALNGVTSSFAGRGTLQSGAAMQALQDRAGQVATQNAFLPYMQLLDNQQRLGLSATLGQASLGQNYVGTVTANNMNAGTDQANAALMRGQSNPFASALGTLGGTLMGGGIKF